VSLQITAHPHPYNSHYNDAVHAYILSRLRPVAASTSYVHISNDQTSNGSWASPGYGVYFEGTNILVKIDGRNSDSNDGVLFSAHYDSVSTAPGATDDGMGVVTLLQLIDHFAKHRPNRTAIFNINNGEEDWLNGAHA
jgi:Zn-dependent M28 family amino/carboxypeptidase